MKSIFLFTIVFLVSCASLTNYVKPEAKKVKTIALVGYTFDQARANNKDNILERLVSPEESNSMALNPKSMEFLRAKHVDFSYKSIAKALQENMNYRVLPKPKVLRNPLIKKIIKESQNGFQTGVLPLQANYQRYGVTNIPQFFHIASLSVEEKTELAKSLKVDAIALVHLNTQLIRNTVLGLGVGDIKSKSSYVLQLISGDNAEYIVNLNVSGEKVMGVEANALNYTDKNEMDAQALKAVQSATKNLFQEWNKLLL